MMNVVDRCVDMMGSMLGGGMMGTGTTMLVLLLFVLLLFWLAGLAAVGAIGFWAVRKLRTPS
jgi:hypothetical protein